MEPDRELAEVFLEEARRHLARLTDGLTSRGERGVAARELAAAAGLLGQGAIKALAEEVAAELARGSDAMPPVRRLAGLLDELDGRVRGAESFDAGELAQLYAAFREEAGDHLDGMTAALIALERDRGQRGLVSQLLRKAHTLKGSAATVSLDAVSEGAHRLEEVLVALGSGALPPSDELFDALIGAVDTLRALLPVAERRADAGPLLARLSAHLEAARPAATSAPAPSLPRPRRATQLTGPSWYAAVPTTRPSRSPASIRRTWSASTPPTWTSSWTASASWSSTARASSGAPGELRAVMRELGRVRTALRGLIRPRGTPRLAEIENDLARHVAHLGRATAALLDDAEALRRTTAVLQSGLTQVRMTKVRWLFQRLARPLRDLERGSGKAGDAVDHRRRHRARPRRRREDHRPDDRAAAQRGWRTASSRPPSASPPASRPSAPSAWRRARRATRSSSRSATTAPASIRDRCAPR
jgi:HPt (histidine-containing phosphotransfer) domain-containing protein